MSVRSRVFIAMAALVLCMGVAFVAASQGFLRNSLPQLLAAAGAGGGESAALHARQQSILDHMVFITLKAGAVLVIIALMTGLWLARKVTAPLDRLRLALDAVGKGELGVQTPVSTRDEFGKVAAALNQMSAQLARAEQARQRLVADVAHELKTPLAIIQGQLEVLQQDGVAVAPERLLPVQDEVIRLTTLVDDLHQLSLAEAGRLALARTETDLVPFLAGVLDKLRYDAEEKAVALSVHAEHERMVVSMDQRRMTQVFLNLLSNGLRYTGAGGAITVTVADGSRHGEDGYVTVAISDTGIGIPEDQLPFVFDRFYRAEEARSRHTGGMGLGLAIAREFVQAHGGSIRAVSRAGDGTTFTVSLPVPAGGKALGLLVDERGS